jgi:tryptophan synthase beta chain
MKTKKIFLPESELPRYWYNILPDMPTPMEPPLHPGTGEPVGPDDFIRGPASLLGQMILHHFSRWH